MAIAAPWMGNTYLPYLAGGQTGQIHMYLAVFEARHGL